MAISSMLVPVSFDERDHLVLRYVCGLSAQSVRKVLVATAVENNGMEAPVVSAEVDRARSRMSELAEQLHDCQMEFEMRVVTGNPTDAMLGLARQTEVDVICCATEGKSFVDYLFSGSVSEDLFASGKVRTMTVRYDLLEKSGDPAQVARDFAKRLVIPVDFSASSVRAFMSAFDRPSAMIDTLHVLHVIPPASANLDATPGPDEFRARNIAETEAKFADLRDIAAEHGVTAECVWREGDAGDAILAYLDEIEATGVITGRRGRGRLREVVLGGVSMQLLRDAPCPVVVQP